MDTEQLEHRFSDAPPQVLLRWAAARFRGAIAMATGFGLEGCALVHIIASERLDIDIFTLDTGLFFDETYELWRRLEQRYAVTIRPVRSVATVDQQARIHGPRLWQRDPDRCCQLRKVSPLHGALGGLDAWVTAIRREQSAARATARSLEADERFGLVKINPLVAWTAAQLWAFVREHDIPYNPLHDRGYPSIGCQPCTSRVAPGEDPRAGRWRGRHKTECGLHGRGVDASSMEPRITKAGGER